MAGESRSLPGLFADLSRETTTLLRQEVELARAEISEKVSQAQRGVVSLAAGAIVLLAGVLALLAGIILLLSLALEPWAAALLVGVVVSAVGGAMVMKGKGDLKAESLKPDRTIRSLRSEATMAKELVQ